MAKRLQLRLKTHVLYTKNDILDLPNLFDHQNKSFSMVR